MPGVRTLRVVDVRVRVRSASPGFEACVWRTSRPKPPPGMDPLGRLGSAEIEEERRTLGTPSAIAPCAPPTLRPRPGSPGREARRVYEGVGAPTMPG